MKTLFQRIDENVFKLSEDKYSTEELQAMWQDDEHGEYIQLSDDGAARYIAHGKAMEEIVPPIGKRTTSQFVGGDPTTHPVSQQVPAEAGAGAERQKFQMIDAWCKQHGFWPNIWYVNERGNIELISKTGKFLGGLV